MQFKKILNVKSLLFTVVAMIVTGFIGQQFALNNPIGWFTLIPSSPPNSGEVCAMAIVDNNFGWPLHLLNRYGKNSCVVDTFFNPISFAINVVLFLMIGTLLFRKKKTISPSNHARQNS